MANGEQLPIEATTRGEVSDAERDAAVEKLRVTVAASPLPVLFARIELRREANPAVERPVIVKAMVEVSGKPVRAHRAAASMDPAVNEVVDRLRRNILRLADRRADRIHEQPVPEPGEWHHGALPEARPEYFPRPADERQVVRRKTYAVGRMTPEEAAFEMDLLDHDFHLFVDESTGADAVVARRPDGGVELHSADPRAGGGPAGEPADLEVRAAYRTASDNALELLDAGSEGFVAYVNPESGRLNVVYRRYDGHYGMIAPQDARSAQAATG